MVDEENLTDILAENLREAGCEVHVVSSTGAARSVLAQSTGHRQVLASPSDLVSGLLGDGDWDLLPFTGADVAPIGLFEADGAVSETGSLFSVDDRLEVRLASTLPPEVFALVRSGNVVRSLEEAMALPSISFLGFITGPSSTGDIEAIHQVGVHGPHRMVVIILTEEGGSR